MLSILGPRSNIYLVDAEGKLLHYMRPLSTTRKELSVGQPWVPSAGQLGSRGADRWREVADGSVGLAALTSGVLRRVSKVNLAKWFTFMQPLP